MPSPFPGMDPFLEDPAGWPDVHHALIGTMREIIAAEVAPRYVVRVEERVYIADDTTDPWPSVRVPDLFVIQPRVQPREAPTGSRETTIAPATVIRPLRSAEVHDRYLVIRDKRGNDIVTAIELLSPANKVRTSSGYEEMVSKRSEILLAGASWIEIDLLRAGYVDEALRGKSEYRVVLKRSEDPAWYAWYADLRDPLPVVGIPLRAPEPDVPLDLQRALDLAYDRAQYASALDYGQPVPPPPLRPADEAWVRERLTAWRAV